MEPGGSSDETYDFFDHHPVVVRVDGHGVVLP